MYGVIDWKSRSTWVTKRTSRATRLSGNYGIKVEWWIDISISLRGLLFRCCGYMCIVNIYLVMPYVSNKQFLSRNLRHFHKNIRSWVEMNAVARAKLTIQMLSLHKNIYHQNQYSNTWGSKCLALIAQAVRAFGMILKVRGSSPPEVETFSVSKSTNVSKEHPFVSRTWMLLSAQS